MKQPHFVTGPWGCQKKSQICVTSLTNDSCSISSLMDFKNILNSVAINDSDVVNSSPIKSLNKTSSLKLSTPTPTKLKNLTTSDIEKLSEEDSLELAMRQSLKENASVRRAIDMSPVGMSEDDQVQ